MFDLALALAWTPLGIAALAAAAAAVAAVLYLPRLALPLALVAGTLAGAAYVSSMRDELASARRERDEAREQAEARARAVEALERTSAARDARAKASAAARARIQAAPPSDDGLVAPVLRRVLEGGR